MKSTYAVPISVKGIVFEGDSVWLRKNERHEWELPGGKLDEGEQPEETAARELSEELGFEVKPLKIIQAHLYIIPVSVDETRGVLVISYLCRLLGKSGTFEVEGEAGPARFEKFPVKDTEKLPMPEFYKEAIRLAWEENSGI